MVKGNRLFWITKQGLDPTVTLNGFLMLTVIQGVRS